MAEFSVRKLGEIGLNTDLAPTEIALNAWNEIQNGRCEDDTIRPFMAWQKWTDVSNTAATWLLDTRRAQIPYWIICGNEDVYLYDGTSFTQINQTIPNSPLEGRWSGTFDGEIPYVNHINDAPQYADYTDPNYLTSPQLKDLQYNAAGSTGQQTFRELNYQVGVLRAHKGFLFAGNWIKSGTSRPSLLAWDGGTASNVPSSDWVPSPTSLAGEFDCVDGGSGGGDDNGGAIVDMLSLRDDLIIYKERTAWIARRTGGTTPAWGLKKLIGIDGLISRDCVVSVKGRHFVWGPDDIYVHQGQTAQSIVDDRVRKTFISQIDPDNYLNCFAVKHYEKKEIMFCGPTQGNTYPNFALVYSWKDGSFYLTDLPGASFITPGTRQGQALSYGDATMTYGEASFTYGQRNFSVLDKSLIGVHPSNQDLLQFDIGVTRWNGSADVSFNTRFEKRSVPLAGLQKQAQVREIHLSATGTGTVQVYVGEQKNSNGPVMWIGPRNFNVETDAYVKIRAKAPLLCWRIDANTGTDWAISNMEIDYKLAGQR